MMRSRRGVRVRVPNRCSSFPGVVSSRRRLVRFPRCSISCRPPPASTVPPLVLLVTFVVPLPSVRPFAVACDAFSPSMSPVLPHWGVAVQLCVVFQREVRGFCRLPWSWSSIQWSHLAAPGNFDFVVRPLASLGRSCTSARPSVLPLRFPPVSRRRSVVAG